MPALLAKKRSWRNARRVKAAPQGFAGSFYGGGPLYADAYRSRRGPTNWEILEQYKGLLYIFANYNAFAVARHHLRLYVITKSGQPQPKSWLGATQVNRAKLEWLKSKSPIAKSLAGADRVEEVTNHPILNAFEMVNPFVDHCQLIMGICYAMDIVGDSYIQPVFETVGRAKVPTELWPLPPQAVEPIPSGVSLVPSGYQYYAKRYELDELIRFRWQSLRNFYMQGYSPARAAIQYARLEDEWVSVQDALLSNGPRPNIMISHADPRGTFGEAERKRLKNEFNINSRAGRQGGVVIADGPVKVTPLSYQLADLGQIKISEYDLNRVANCFQVPPPLYSQDTNLANIEAAEDLHSKDAVEPRHRTVASTLTRYFRGLDTTGKLGWDRLIFAFDPCVAEDKKLAAELHKTYHDMGVQSKNEIRLEIGLEPMENGDEILVANTLVRLKDVVAGVKEEPEPKDALLADEAQGAEDENVEEQNGDVDAEVEEEDDDTPRDADGGAGSGGASADDDEDEDEDDDEKEKKPSGKTFRVSGKANKSDEVDGLDDSDGSDGSDGSLPSTEALLTLAAERLGFKYDDNLTAKQRLAMLHDLRLIGRAWLRREAERTLAEIAPDTVEKSLVGDAAAKVKGFFGQAGKFLRNLFVAGSLAVFGPHTPTHAEIEGIDKAHAVQMEYMDRFHRQVVSGEQPLDGTFPARAEQYGSSVWGAGVNTARDVVSASNLFVEEMREHLGEETATDPCSTCRELRNMGWQPIGTLPPIGESPCGSMCHCSFTFRTEDGTEYDVGGGPLDEYAFGTR